jgi:glycyl-tRNA synthetase
MVKDRKRFQNMVEIKKIYMAENSLPTMETLVGLAKRRGFVFPSSEIYGGFAGVYDYGPLGVLLLNNIKQAWWRQMVQLRPDIVGLDAGIIMNPKVWVASGHVGGFSDPLVECRVCHTRSRADHLLEEAGVAADEKMSLEEINNVFAEYLSKIRCPRCGSQDFTEVKFFNLLVSSNLGDFSGTGAEPAYLRGETCQGIYVNYKNVLDTSHPKLPFGIAQVGKAFRNEITPRQFLFRTREFEQMEMQYFARPLEATKHFEDLKEYRMAGLIALGIRPEKLRFKQHERLVFYAKDAYDIEFEYPFGWKELEGVHNRGDYDLTQHGSHSGVDLSYFDEQTKERFVPHILESSVGVGRLFLALLANAYQEELVEGEPRVVLKLSPALAPYKIAVLPLSKKEELSSVARNIFDTLKETWFCQYDETQSIGKRYRRQDEIGTPYCVTVDFDSLTDGQVTVRDRDTMTQERVAISELPRYFTEKFTL